MKPVIFNDEFEYIAYDGCCYDIMVKCKRGPYFGKVINSVIEFTITNYLGELVDLDHPMYEEIKEEVYERDYELETHNANFDYYNSIYERNG